MPSNKALQPDKGNCHGFCIRKSYDSFPLPLSLVVRRHETMTETERLEWTEADFDEMSWHDNPLHAIRVVEGRYGAGKLLLDIDYILEWLRGDSGETSFRIAPATLEFREVTNLRIELDYETPTAGLTPFSLDRIERLRERRDRYAALLWTLAVNWPVGSITFEAKGFRQSLRGPVVMSPRQHLSAEVHGIGA